jgi:predicted transcriptional regulator
VKEILNARVLCGNELLEQEVKSICGSDLMSDVLASDKELALLLTGLTHCQVIRTAEMIDIKAIVFVRGKRPDDSLIDIARDRGIPLMVTQYPLFEACGLLYREGKWGIEEES